MTTTVNTEAKRFATLQAQFALHGHTLHRSGPGPVSFMAERKGLVRYLPALNDAERFLAQMGDGIMSASRTLLKSPAVECER